MRVQGMVWWGVGVVVVGTFLEAGLPRLLLPRPTSRNDICNIRAHVSGYCGGACTRERDSKASYGARGKANGRRACGEGRGKVWQWGGPRRGGADRASYRVRL